MGSGSGVTVYALGEDIDPSSVDFLGGRISSVKFVSRTISECPQVCECWQGTHVASLTGGTLHGVAKLVTQIPVVVKPGCRLAGSTLMLVRGLQWIIDHRRSLGEDAGPAVVVTSTKVAIDRTDRVAIDLTEDLFRAIINMNVTVVATAGANAADSSKFSPGRMRECLTVAGLDVFSDASKGKLTSQPWMNSNYGADVDVWAPAAYITASSSDAGDTLTFSGVPQASGIVAGVIATMLESDPDMTPDQVREAIVASASEVLMVGGRPRTVSNVLQMPRASDRLAQRPGTP